MKNFFKNYWVSIISILFFGIYGMLMGMIFSSDALFINDAIGVSAVILTFILVIAIYGAMIYLIIHAANNKDLKNKILWCLGIYFLNVFIMPYYHLKHVCGEKKLKIKMLIFTAVSLFVFASCMSISIIADSKQKVGPLYIIEDDVKFTFPSSYRETDIGEYDIYAKDRKRNINFGAFIYDEDDNDTVDAIMLNRDKWIKSSREDVVSLRGYKEETFDRVIDTNIYIATHNGVKNIYYISTIEFKQYDVFVNTLAVNLYEDDLDYQDEFKEILRNMEYIGTEEDL